MDVINHSFVLPLAGTCELNHANYIRSVVEVIEEFALELLLIVDGPTLEVGIPIECIGYKGSHKNYLTMSSS